MSAARTGKDPIRGFALAWAALSGLFVVALAIDLVPHIGPALSTPITTHEAIDLAGKVISDLNRMLGVTLSMLVALCALAIPLTANVYTPKLIEIFVNDTLNRVVLTGLVLANAIVLWNKWILAGPTPDGAQVRLMVCLGIGLLGVLTIGPYLLYVLRFLLPTTIIGRLERQVLADLDTGGHAASTAARVAADSAAIQNIKVLGNITLRSVERYDRETALQCLQALRNIFETYQAHKDLLPPSFLQEQRGSLLGLSPELAREVERLNAVIEVALLQELQLVLPLAMDRLPELVARVASIARHIGARTAERGDAGSHEMAILHFNTFLRHTLKNRHPDAFYKFVYQYRRLAEELLEIEPRLAWRVAFYLDYYGHQAVRMGMGYLINVVAYDMAAVCDLAYRMETEGRRELLDLFVRLDRDEAQLLDMPGVVKAQIILAARLRTRGLHEATDDVLTELRKVKTSRLEEAFSQIMRAHEENFWEIADRRRHLDHVEPEYRDAVEWLRRELLGQHVPGRETERFLRAAPAPAVPCLKGRSRTRRRTTITDKYLRVEAPDEDDEGGDAPEPAPADEAVSAARPPAPPAP